MVIGCWGCSFISRSRMWFEYAVIGLSGFCKGYYRPSGVPIRGV